MIPNPHALEGSLRKLGRLNRKPHRRRLRSKRRNQTRRRLARVHARTANLRRDALHNLTTTLATEHGTIVVEQLNLAGMLRNPRLARALSDAGLAERTFTCEACGSQLDRDMNAARNLAKLAQHVARSGRETQNARGADRKPQLAGRVAMKREAGSPSGHETGTAAPAKDGCYHPPQTSGEDR